jgi:hypothetical protein
MYFRKNRAGKYEYVQIVESFRESGKVRQRVLLTVGEMRALRACGQMESLMRSGLRFCERLAVLEAHGKDGGGEGAKVERIGPHLVFGRLWEESGIADVVKGVADERQFGFDIERAVYLTVLHRLCVSGSDRAAEKWREDYRIPGTEKLELHQLYRAMGFLGEPLPVEEQENEDPAGPRCVKDRIEERLFERRRDLFSGLEMVFFDTTSIYFEGDGGESLGQYGHSKDHRPDLKQMVVGVVLDGEGRPLCSEMWPGNVADVTTLVPVVDRLQKRFGVGKVCIVADRGMISDKAMKEIEAREWEYILGVRMRRVVEVRDEVLGRAGRYQEVMDRDASGKEKAPLKVKEVRVGERRYLVCVNEDQALKDAQDREAIVEALRSALRQGDKALIGNKGYRKFVKGVGQRFTIDEKKIREEARFDGKWVLTTNGDRAAAEVALQYKRLWMVEEMFRTMKSLLETRPIYHKCDETIRGHVFCSFLALVLRVHLQEMLEKKGLKPEWNDLLRDLDRLQEIETAFSGRRFALRSQLKGCAGAVLRAVGVAVPPTIREL